MYSALMFGQHSQVYSATRVRSWFRLGNSELPGLGYLLAIARCKFREGYA